MFQKIKRSCAVALLTGLFTNSAFAENFNKQDMAFAFADSSLNHAMGDMALLSNQEMMETDGNGLPLFAIGHFFRETGRFIATRYVSRNAAAKAVRSGCGVMCYGSAQQAKSLGRQAFGKNLMRHGPSHHKNSHVDYSHFQSIMRKPSQGHIFYGSRFPR